MAPVGRYVFAEMWGKSEQCTAGSGAPRSESEFTMIAGGNHSIIPINGSPTVIYRHFQNSLSNAYFSFFLFPRHPHARKRLKKSYSGVSFSKKSPTCRASAGSNSSGPGAISRVQPISPFQAKNRSSSSFSQGLGRL